MAPRANWKGFLRLSLVMSGRARSGTSESVSFNQLNRKTGHRIKYAKVAPTPARRLTTSTSSRGTRSIPIRSSR
ncbi:protein of unknown function [Bradyrhizobium vignae]|uniref:Ku domain-containing protein n=1 Tax=Bradyrhizobium vignae TaxID=1549949 RepID=A0A2U3PU58_9BRAD|nr:protein of unknown function [Bradyrhizobium vignae]